MKVASVYLSDREKAHIASYGYNKNYWGNYLYTQLVKADEENVFSDNYDRSIFIYRPCDKMRSINTTMSSSDFTRLVEKPSIKLDITYHSYVSALFFKGLEEDFGIQYSQIADTSNESKYDFMTFRIRDEYYDMYKVLKGHRSSTDYFCELISKYKDTNLLDILSQNQEIVSAQLINDWLVASNTRKRGYSRQILATKIPVSDHLLLKSLAYNYNITMNRLVELLLLTNYIQLGFLDNQLSANDSTLDTNEDTSSVSMIEPTSFYDTLSATISVTDPKLGSTVVRTFRDCRLAEQVYTLLCNGKYDLLNCQLAKVVYTNISVNFNTVSVPPSNQEKHFDEVVRLSLNE